MVLETEPPPVAAVRPDVPYELAGIVMRCLQKDPARRFSGVGELTRALFAFSPPPASPGLIRSEPPQAGAVGVSGARGVDTRPEAWGETLVGPTADAAPHVISTGREMMAQSPRASSLVPNVSSLAPSGAGGASLTVPRGGRPAPNRAIPIALAIVGAVFILGAGAAGIALLWTSQASMTSAVVSMEKP